MNVRKVLIVEGCVNLLIAMCKFIIGLSTNSSAIIADAAHSATDVFNNIVAWFAIRLSEKPADDTHTYGHQKYEQLAVFILASLLVIVAFEILVGAVERFGQVVEQSVWGLTILIAVLVINLALALWERHWAHKLDSDILHADVSHTFSDVISSISVLVGWQLAANGWYWIDGVFAVVMALIIFYLAYKLYLKAIPTLVDYTDIDKKELLEAVSNVDGVLQVGSLRSVTRNKERFADITVSVNESLTLKESHEIADAIEQLVLDEFDIRDAVVHVEPFDTK